MKTLKEYHVKNITASLVFHCCHTEVAERFAPSIVYGCVFLFLNALLCSDLKVFLAGTTGLFFKGGIKLLIFHSCVAVCN